MKLYGYFRSSAAYRARIALNLKGLSYESEILNLRDGEQSGAEFKQLNPQGFVPVLKDGGAVLTQSYAIMEYLDYKYPRPPLLPSNEFDRAYVSSIALAVACDIHPLNNLRILRYLEYNLDLDEHKRNQWYQRWVAEGLDALECKIAAEGRYGLYCLADSPTVADVFLIPQMANARRFNCDLSKHRILKSIDANCRKLKPFIDAAPQQQPDAI